MGFTTEWFPVYGVRGGLHIPNAGLSLVIHVFDLNLLLLYEKNQRTWPALVPRMEIIGGKFLS